MRQKVLNVKTRNNQPMTNVTMHYITAYTSLDSTYATQMFCCCIADMLYGLTYLISRKKMDWAWQKCPLQCYTYYMMINERTKLGSNKPGCLADVA